MDNCNLAKIGKRISERRKSMGLTQEQLAEAADSSQQHICDIENGKVKEPGGTLLLRLTYAFNITLNDLFGDP